MIGSANAIARWIETHDEIAVITHIRPDGDALGTALALVNAIGALGKRVFAVCEDPAEKKYLFLPGVQSLYDLDGMPYAPKAVLTCDVADRGRMGKLEQVFDSVPECDRAVVDHHHTNPGFAPVSWVDGDSASCGEMALELMDELGVKLSPQTALCLFTAISTDCGNFSFGNTTGWSYRYAARCVEAGVDVEDITRKLYRTRSLQKTRLIGLALSKLETYFSGKVAVISISNDMFREAGADHTDTHSIVNYLNEIEGVKIGFVCEQTEDGNNVKFSFRAAGGADVSALAAEFGGGGHVAAAGATVRDTTLDEIVPKVVKAAGKYVQEMT